MKRAALSVVALLAALTLAGCGTCPADCQIAGDSDNLIANPFTGHASTPLQELNPLATYNWGR